VSGASRMTPSARGPNVQRHPLVLVPLALTLWVYYPITRVFFFADDLLHLARIASGRPLTFVLAPYGGHNYHLRNLVFLGLWHLFGLHSELWYWTVLLTHLLNVWLLFGVLGFLTADVGLACLGATIWGICPLGVGTLGFYSVYGQVMASTILLVVLKDLVRLSAAGTVLTARRALVWYALLLAGTTCFGTGIGAALAFPLVLFLLLPAAWRQPRVRIAYLALPAVALVGYFALKRFYTLFEPMPFEELLHEVLAEHGLLAAPAMMVQLLGFAVAGSTLSYFFAPYQYPNTRDLVSIAAFAVGLGCIAWRGDWRRRRNALAMMALAVGIYSVIAIGRAKMYAGFNTSSVQAAAFLRYHYEATIPIVVLLCLILQQVVPGRLPAVARGFILAAALGVLVVGYLHANSWIDEHAATRSYFRRTAEEIADAAAAAPPGATVYLENGREPAAVVGIFLDIVFPGRAGVFLLLSPSSDLVDGRRVRFIERDPKVLEAWSARPTEPLAKLLVPPHDAPARP
jgi:hypothetical protein